MLNSDYIKKLGIDLIINYNRKSRADEELERKTGEDTLKSMRELMDRALLPLGIPYDQEDEIGSGDKISTRPVFQRIIDRLRNGTYQAIAVKEITRMGRGSYTDMGIIYDLIVDKCIFIITPWKVYDPRNPTDLRQIRFELFLSREEFETTKERLTGGRYNKALEGKWMSGKPPYGYDLDSKTKKLVINDDQANIVRLVFDFYVNGILDKDGNTKSLGHRALCTYLTRIGTTSPDGGLKWYPSVIKYMLKNPVYIGTMIYGRTNQTGDTTKHRPSDEWTVIENAYPPIVDPETFEESIRKNDDAKVNKYYAPKVKFDTVAGELTGLIVCKKCGNKMLKQFTTQKYTKRKTGEQMVYNKEFLWCRITGCNFVKYRAVEQDLLETLKYLRDVDQSKLKAIVERMVSKKVEKKDSSEDLIKMKEKRKQELKNRLNFIYEKFESGVYSDEMFLERKSEIEKELDALERAIIYTQTQADEEKDKFDPALFKSQLASFIELYEHEKNIEKKNRIFRTFFEYAIVDVIKKGRGSIPAKHVTFPLLRYTVLHNKTLVV